MYLFMCLEYFNKTVQDSLTKEILFEIFDINKRLVMTSKSSYKLYLIISLNAFSIAINHSHFMLVLSDY